MRKALHGHLDSAFVPGYLSFGGQKIGDVIPGMAVQRSPKLWRPGSVRVGTTGDGTYAFLIDEMGNQTDLSTQDEKSIEDADLHVFCSWISMCRMRRSRKTSLTFSLFGREGTGVSEQVHEADLE